MPLSAVVHRRRFCMVSALAGGGLRTVRSWRSPLRNVPLAQFKEFSHLSPSHSVEEGCQIPNASDGLLDKENSGRLSCSVSGTDSRAYLAILRVLPMKALTVTSAIKTGFLPQALYKYKIRTWSLKK